MSSSAATATAVENPAVDRPQLVVESDNDDDEDDTVGHDGEFGRSGGGSVGQGQGDFDKWLRDLLVDMQTSIERHVASVFQTQTEASVVP